jgi:hypothetical protein
MFDVISRYILGLLLFLLILQIKKTCKKEEISKVSLKHGRRKEGKNTDEEKKKKKGEHVNTITF